MIVAVIVARCRSVCAGHTYYTRSIFNAKASTAVSTVQTSVPFHSFHVCFIDVFISPFILWSCRAEFEF